MTKKTEIDYDRLYEIAQEGLTLAEISKIFEVSERTLYRWINNDPKLCQTLNAAKLIADKRVEDSLYKRALGYKYDEVTYEKVKIGGLGADINDEGEIESIKHTDCYKTKIVTREIPPDVTAQIFWLKNRKPDEWRDKKEFDYKENKKITITVTEIPLEERKEIINNRIECTN